MLNAPNEYNFGSMELSQWSVFYWHAVLVDRLIDITVAKPVCSAAIQQA